MTNEQWKANGICEECRRVNYCKTKCKAHVNKDKKELGNLVRDVAIGIITGAAKGL